MWDLREGQIGEWTILRKINHQSSFPHRLRMNFKVYKVVEEENKYLVNKPINKEFQIRRCHEGNEQVAEREYNEGSSSYWLVRSWSQGD